MKPKLKFKLFAGRLPVDRQHYLFKNTMNKEIQVIDNTTIIFHKALWKTEYIDLALCLGFEFKPDENIVTAHIPSTTKKALHDFLNTAFQSIMSSESSKNFRTYLFAQIKEAYQYHWDKFSDELLPKVGYQDKLFKHQISGLFDGAFKKNVFYAYDMGLGKSITAASRSKMFKCRTTIIVCPAIVKWNWFRELTEKWGFNQLYFTLLDSSKTRTLKAFQERFIIINYEMLPKFMSYLQNSKCEHIILDEAHKLKNLGTNIYRNVSKLYETFPDAYLTLLSGTPIKNRCNDLLAYLKLTKHHLGGNHAEFLRRYTYASSGRGGDRVAGGKNKGELHLRLGNFMLRKTKEECLDLPEKIITKYYFELDDFKDEYNKVLEEMANAEEGKAQLNSSLHSLNIVTTKSKLPGAREIIDTILEQDRKVVVFCSYKEPLNELADFYKEACVKIDGSVPAHERDARIQKFWNDPECKIFLGNMIAAGVGINLTNASDVIFLNFPFTSSDLHQCIDRCQRIGQKNTVNVYYTICQNTIDENLFDLIADKHNEINEIIDKGKPDIIEYENLPDKLFKQLVGKVKENA